MDKKQLKDMIEPSIMQRVNEINEIHKKIDPLYQIKNPSKISEITEQNARISSALSIGEIAKTASERSSLFSTNFENQSTIARYADLRSQEMMVFQDTFLKIPKEVSAYNNIMTVRESIIKSIGGNSAYKDMMASVNLARKSMEPLRDSLNTAGKAFNGNEFVNLVRELQTSRIISESALSEYSGIFEQFESLRNLESFKAISRLKNFPNDKVWAQNYDKAFEITEDSLAEAKNIDARISDEVSSVDDFNDLSEEAKGSLLLIVKMHYWKVIHYLAFYICLNMMINNGFSANESFTIHDLQEMMHLAYQEFGNGVIASILANYIVKEDKEKNNKK